MVYIKVYSYFCIIKFYVFFFVFFIPQDKQSPDIFYNKVIYFLKTCVFIKSVLIFLHCTSIVVDNGANGFVLLVYMCGVIIFFWWTTYVLFLYFKFYLLPLTFGKFEIFFFLFGNLAIIRILNTRREHFI